MTLWYSLRHPWGQKKESEGPAFSCPINCCRTYMVQPPVPAWVSITGSDRSIWQQCCPADCPSSLSFWSICTSIGPCSCGCCFLCLLHVKKSQKPQRKCKYPLMALIQMDALMTIAPLCLWFGFLSVRNTEATTITQQNYACRTSPIDVLKSTASCYDNWVSSFQGRELLSLNASVRT